MVLQDRCGVIEDAKTIGLAGFIEPMAASFFERQPVESLQGGSSIYSSDYAALIYFRDVKIGALTVSDEWKCQEPWSITSAAFSTIGPDNVVLTILQNIIPAVGPRSRILIIGYCGTKCGRTMAFSIARYQHDLFKGYGTDSAAMGELTWEGRLQY